MFGTDSALRTVSPVVGHTPPLAREAAMTDKDSQVTYISVIQVVKIHGESGKTKWISSKDFSNISRLFD